VTVKLFNEILLPICKKSLRFSIRRKLRFVSSKAQRFCAQAAYSNAQTEKKKSHEPPL